MPFEMMFNLIALAVASAWSPGPNNALVANSGATFGISRTVPHILGIALGFALMIFIVGLFLGELFQRSALLRESLRWVGAGLLLYVAWKVATSGGISLGKGEPRPFTFLEAAGFQWINPKAWAMAIAVTAQFIPAEAPMPSAMIVALIFALVGLGSATSWAVGGRAALRLLGGESQIRLFNMVMGVLVAGCVVLLWL
ncbi:MAG: LysE family translocator [Rhodobacteraceae bacterium]|nr:LysE family translocator [Paracoccaceae bacterium]